jgi:hypothetical protein
MATTARHREDGTRQVNLTLDREALTWLCQRATTRRAYGQFLSRLLYEDRAVFEERKRLAQTGAQALAAVGAGDDDVPQT